MISKGNIVFSFDDARLDSYEAIKIAERYGIKSTLNVTTGYVDGSLPKSNKDFPVPAMTKEQVIELYNNPFVEIACHSHNHTNTFDDIIKGKKELYDWVKPNGELGFVSPGSSVDFNVNPLSKFKGTGFLYVRIGPIWGKYAKILRILRKASRIFQSPFLCYLGYRSTLKNAVEENYLIHGVPVIHDNTLKQFTYLVDKCSQEGLTCVFIFHSILSKGVNKADDNWSWDKDDYVRLCEYIHKKMNDGIESCFTRELLNL